MKNQVNEHIQARVRARLRMLQHAQRVSGVKEDNGHVVSQQYFWFSES
jgi:hypothetical protein